MAVVGHASVMLAAARLPVSLQNPGSRRRVVRRLQPGHPRTDRPAEVTLAFEPARCDPHAVAEDKRGTFLGVHARVDGVEQEVVHLPPGDALRGAVHDFVAAACGWPSS